MRVRRQIAALAAALALLSAGCGGAPLPAQTAAPAPPQETSLPAPEPAPEPTPEPSPEPTPEPSPEPGPPEYSFEYGFKTDPVHGSYQCFDISGLTPYVFVPNGPGRETLEDMSTAAGMLERYGEEYGMIAAFNSGIFYDTLQEDFYCFHGKEPDGMLIAGGVVLKSTEPLDHSECDILVIDEDGSAGWTDFWADADALAAGEGYYYDIYGSKVTGKKIVSALTGFVPILVNGRVLYDPEDPVLWGYDNFVNHYRDPAPRQIFGARADGSFVMLANYDYWTLADAAEVALAEGCVFAYNLDGGDSVESAVGEFTEDGYAASAKVKVLYGSLIPTFLVFTDTNRPPRSVTPESITAALPADAAFSAGVTAETLAGAVEVTEHFANADGKSSSRRVYSAQARTGRTLEHTVVGADFVWMEQEVRTRSQTPDGTLFYTKNEGDRRTSLTLNGNTREDDRYYDYSGGFTLSTEDDLNTPGEKTLLVSYVPGDGLEPLTASLRVVLN